MIVVSSHDLVASLHTQQRMGMGWFADTSGFCEHWLTTLLYGNKPGMGRLSGMSFLGLILFGDQSFFRILMATP